MTMDYNTYIFLSAIADGALVQVPSPALKVMFFLRFCHDTNYSYVPRGVPTRP